MPLPFQPEKIELMRARLPKALSVIYDVAHLKVGGLRPGQRREHLFDFVDGIRCILSVDRDGPDDPVLHFSFSTWKETTLGKFKRRIEQIPNELFPDIVLVREERIIMPKAIHFIYRTPPNLLTASKA